MVTATRGPLAKRRSPARLAERLRRAICSDDLAAAIRIAEQARLESTDACPFTIQNQDLFGGDEASGCIVLPIQDAGAPSSSMAANRGRSTSNTTTQGASSTSAGILGGAWRDIGNHMPAAKMASVAEATGHASASIIDCPGLSGSQYSYAKHCRTRDRNREAGRAKSSLALAVENDASIEMIQWLLNMGHEDGHISVDARGCTIVSLAAQYGRADVIEACCTDAVAHAASIHHLRSVERDHRESMLAYNEFGEDTEITTETDADGIEQDGGEDDDDDDLANDHSYSDAADQTPRASRRPSGADALTSSYNRFKGIPPVESDESYDSYIDDESDANNIVAVSIRRLLDAPDELGRTALSLASMKGFHDVVRLLIDYGASLDQADYEGNTPLHYAAAYNQLLVVQLLIERGCVFAQKNVFDFTAADYAYTTSLKSALEAFARAQHDGKRNARTRGANVGSAPSLLSNALQVTKSPIKTARQASNSSAAPSSSFRRGSASTLATDGLKGLLSLGSARSQALHHSASSSALGTSLQRSPDSTRHGSPRFKQPSARHGGIAP